MDLDAIAPGVDFAHEIGRALADARVVLAVIGPRWSDVTLADGTRRLDDARDYVRLELAAALAGAERVIPVCVGGAAMPIEHELPEPLRPLARLNAVFLKGVGHEDAEVLVRAVAEALGEGHRELAPHSNVPAVAAALVGRDSARIELADVLGSRGVRVLTLTGPGGTGKTSLALQVARDVSSRYPDGTFFVPLAEVDDAVRITEQVAALVGVREQPDLRLASSVSRILSATKLLLILDNLEHLSRAGPVVSSFLGSGEGAHVLATSRTPLRIPGERLYEVPPLPVPDPAAAIDEIVAAPAVQLFLERAQALDLLHEPSGDDLRAIGDITARVDGLPLAVELAAARVRTLPPRAMLARFDDRLAILSSRGEGQGERRRTLRATIAWSHDLLRPEVKSLFGRLAVFVGGFSLSAAEAVCLGDGDVSVLEAIEELVEHSLVRVVDDCTDPRFGLLETIREYASERLMEDPDRESTLEAHATFYAARSSEAESTLVEADYLDLISPDSANCFTALEWADKQERADLVLQLAYGIFRFTVVRGLPSRVFDMCRKHCDARDVSPEVLVDGVLATAEMARGRGDYGDAIALKGSTLPLLRSSPELVTTLAATLSDMGEIELARGDLKAARRYLEEGLDLELRDGSPERVAHAQQPLGDLLLAEGDPVAAKEILTRAFEGYERSRWRSYGTVTLVSLAESLLALGDTEGGFQRLRAALVRLTDEPSVLETAASLNLIASELTDRDAVSAIRLWAACDRILTDAQLRLPPRHDIRSGLERCRGSLSASEYATAWDDGFAWSVERAIALGLETLSVASG